MMASTAAIIGTPENSVMETWIHQRPKEFMAKAKRKVRRKAPDADLDVSVRVRRSDRAAGNTSPAP